MGEEQSVLCGKPSRARGTNCRRQRGHKGSCRDVEGWAFTGEMVAPPEAPTSSGVDARYCARGCGRPVQAWHTLCWQCSEAAVDGRDCAVRPPSAAPTGRKDDAAKPLWNLLPWASVAAVVDVLTYGAKKYAPNNWQLVDSPRDRYFAAALRHLVAWQGGEKRDPESGLLHLAHAVCCLLFLIWFDKEEGK